MNENLQNINDFLETKLAEISIDDESKANIKKKIKDFFDIIKRYFKDIRGYAFGGSFDRYTSIPSYFDIDLYCIFTYNSIKSLSGINLRNKLMNILRQLETDDDEDLTPYYVQVKSQNKYYHSIPIILDNIKIDFLAAVEIPNKPNTYYIPNGDKIEESSPILIQEKVQNFNKQTNGMGTKLIRLLKLWNYTHGKHLKSYQLELLCCFIFIDRNKAKKFDSLKRGIEIFMDKGFNYIQMKETSFVKGMLDSNISYEAINQFREAKELILNKRWDKLFVKDT
ncbi:hypothetical protein [Candidatus Lokiarchaeum ossiferum]|uniref:hypothetical protein n=1 Tax=Candidatus Lokiarchaeum ossiferum TaxID=2951803 RepID=UPI00352DBBD4